MRTSCERLPGGHNFHALWCLIAILATSACETPLESMPEEARPSEMQLLASLLAGDLKEAATQGDNSRSFESEILRVEAQVPGVGGIYFDSELGRVVVLVTDPARSEAARQVVARYTAVRGVSTADGRGLRNPPVEVRQAEYAFSQLVA